MATLFANVWNLHAVRSLSGTPVLLFAANNQKTRASGLLRRAPFHCKQTGTSKQSISVKRVFQSFLPMRSHVKVRVLRVPPSRALEGIDLRPYGLQKGNVYELDPQVAQVLIVLVVWLAIVAINVAHSQRR